MSGVRKNRSGWEWGQHLNSRLNSGHFNCALTGINSLKLLASCPERKLRFFFAYLNYPSAFPEFMSSDDWGTVQRRDLASSWRKLPDARATDANGAYNRPVMDDMVVPSAWSRPETLSVRLGGPGTIGGGTGWLYICDSRGGFAGSVRVSGCWLREGHSTVSTEVFRGKSGRPRCTVDWEGECTGAEAVEDRFESVDIEAEALLLLDRPTPNSKDVMISSTSASDSSLSLDASSGGGAHCCDVQWGGEAVQTRPENGSGVAGAGQGPMCGHDTHATHKQHTLALAPPPPHTEADRASECCQLLVRGMSQKHTRACAHTHNIRTHVRWTNRATV